MSNPFSWQTKLLAVCAGGLAPLSLSPVNLWPLGVISVVGLYALLQNLSVKHSTHLGWNLGWYLGWYYGLGFFGVGVSWIYVSIHVYGNASALFAGFLTLLFVSALALLFSLQCGLFLKFYNKKYQPLCFAAIWLLFEWLRSWLLTGFPWLYLGYAHSQTALAGYAPIIGVTGISFIIALTGASLYHLYRHYLHHKKTFTKHFQLLLSGLGLLWILPIGLISIDWVQEHPEQKVTVALVQANIDQNQKFAPASLQSNLDLYQNLTEPLFEKDIVFWPETAIPFYYQNAQNILEYYQEKASSNNSTLITGIFFAENDKVHNSIISLGNGTGIHHKQKMVPFGEYVPFFGLMSNVLQLFNLPMSNLQPGLPQQSLLSAANLNLAPYICYEVVYPDLVRRHAIGADFLVTISNDSWFGASFGPLQHLQMAGMRALENGRYMVRATSNGVSAIINEKGKIVKRTQQFQVETLSGEVNVFTGRTPFSLWGSWPITIFCAVILVVLFRRQSALHLKEEN